MSVTSPPTPLRSGEGRIIITRVTPAEWEDFAARLRAEDADAQASRARYDFTQSDACWMLLARVDSASAGYASVVRVPKADARVGFLFVDGLSVLPAFRRMGVATALLQHVETLARELGLAGVRLLVRHKTTRRDGSIAARASARAKRFSARKY